MGPCKSKRVWATAILIATGLCALLVWVQIDTNGQAAPKKKLIEALKKYDLINVEHIHVKTMHTQTMSAGRDSHPEVRFEPSRYNPKMQKHQYPSRHEVKFQAFGEEYHLELSQNTKMFSPSYVEIRQDWRNGKLVGEHRHEKGQEAHSLWNCHYKGSVRGHPESVVSVSLCKGGISGIIDRKKQGESAMFVHTLTEKDVTDFGVNRNKVTFQWEQTEQSMKEDPHSKSHLIYFMSDYTEDERYDCGVEDTLDHHQAHDVHSRLHSKMSNTYNMNNNKKAASRALKAAVNQNYVELLLTNDVGRYNEFTIETENESAEIANIADGYYQATNFDPPQQVVLVAQITWTTSNPISYSVGTCASCSGTEVDPDELLSVWNSWRSTDASVPAHDNGHLLSSEDFAAFTVGYAPVGSMCTSSTSGGIDMTTGYTSQRNANIASTLAHEMGHNFGMSHDGTAGNTACASSGNIMAAVGGATPNTQFSNCSLSNYDTFMAGLSSDCLEDVPTTLWADGVCGNGFVEEGEECDCGASDCTGIDDCCHGSNCTLSQGVCSDLDPCCNGCQLRSAAENFECRSVDHVDCDVAEYCDGLQSACPEDRFAGAGNDCDSSSGKCYDGECHSLDGDCQQHDSNYFGCSFHSTLASQANEDYCYILYCDSASSSNCFSLTSGGGSEITVSDGVPCGDGKQCLNNVCTNSGDLSPTVEWLAEAWNQVPCEISCDNSISRTRECRFLNGNTSQDESYCSPANAPATTMSCRDHSVCADAHTTYSVPLLGDTDNEWILYAFIGGIILITGICIYACVWMWRDDPDPWHPLNDDPQGVGTEAWYAAKILDGVQPLPSKNEIARQKEVSKYKQVNDRPSTNMDPLNM